VERGVIVLDKPVDALTFTGLDARPVLSLNRGFSAPIRLTTDLTADDLRVMAARDSDSFNRWQAVQTLATALLVGNTAQLRAGQDPQADDGLIEALGAILADPGLEPAFIAEALTPPSEADIAREIGRDVDPDAIYRARAGLQALIGLSLNADLGEAYRRLAGTGPYSPDAVSAGRRALRNVALDLMAATGEPHIIALAAEQYRSADNMTDRMAALATLNLHDVPARAQAIDDFYQYYRDEPLIVDKWFALQAAAPHGDTLERVRELTAHPAFSLANPNRVRALIGVFAQGNQKEFNRPDGAGYDFVAQKIIELDGANPQIGARLTTAFKSWRTLEPRRRALAEAALRRVAAASGLSRDVSDITHRALTNLPY
jgi:aminopeptidase N